MEWNQILFLNEDFLDPYPALINPLPANIFPNILAPNVSNYTLRNPPLCSFASFLIVSLTPSNDIPESSRDSTIFKIYSISSFENIKVVLSPDPKIFLCIPASAADAAADPKGIKTLLANVLIAFFINGNPVLSNGPKSLPRNYPVCIILDQCVFGNLISVDAWLAKALRRFATCLLGSNNL